MAAPVLGILTLYLNDRGLLEERSVYARMTAFGRKLGLRVVVFTPQDVNESRGSIRAHVFDPEKRVWTRATMPLPDLIFDRCRIQRSPRFNQLLRFRAKYGHLTFLNRPLRNKWTVYRTLARQAAFRPHLPETRLYGSPREVREMLAKHALIYVKPANGTGGRGILRIQRERGGYYLVQGRDLSRRIVPVRRVSAAGLDALLSGWRKGAERSYLVQQGIQLKLANGRVHDYRLLVQKNGRGVWEVTGCAGRVGASGSVTSNLHGGGRAASMETLLTPWVGDAKKAERIRREAGELGIAVASHLEEAYDALCELALDLAIDRSGRIWLLEVNPKPAREVFARTGDKETYRKSITRPLEYAMWLYGRRRKDAE